MSRESTKMVIPWPFASEANYALGNYVERQTDGTPDKVFLNSLEAMGNRYSKSNGKAWSMFNTLIAGEGKNVVFPLIGDSISDGDEDYFFLTIEKLAVMLPNTLFMYNDFDNINGHNHLTHTRNVPSDLLTIRGLTSNNGQFSPIKEDNSEWTSPDLAVSFLMSGVDISTSTFRPLAKWNNVLAESSFFVSIEPAGQLRLRWSDGTIQHEHNFGGHFTGLLPADFLGVYVTMDVDDGLGNHVIRLYTSNGFGAWTEIDSVVIVGITSINKTASVPFELHTINQVAPGIGTLHTVSLYNGIDGGLVSIPINIEEWQLRGEDNNMQFTGSVNVCHVYNGAVGGEGFGYFTESKLKQILPPDSFMTMITSLGHNNAANVYDAMYTDLDDYITRVTNVRDNVQHILITQTPKDIDNIANKTGAFTTELRALVIRQYASEHSFDCVDFNTWIWAAIIPILPNWFEDYMADPVHPNPDGSDVLSYGLFGFITGR